MQNTNKDNEERAGSAESIASSQMGEQMSMNLAMSKKLNFAHAESVQ